ncbi:hypothetical protein JCM10213_005313 [Rhodosporidiobolus nylandii]
MAPIYPPSAAEPPIATASPVDLPLQRLPSPSSRSASPTLAGPSSTTSRGPSDEVAVKPGGGKDEAGPSVQQTGGAATSAPYTIYSNSMRWFIVVLVALAGLFSLSANIYLPVIPAVAEDLGTTVEKINLSVLSYMALQAVSPTFFGAICDVLGRRPAYISTFLVYLGACAGLANTHSYALLIVLRCLQAAGSASVIAIGSGSIGDIAPPSERGKFVSLFGLGPMVGPCIGPVIGGLLADHFGWQSLFWFLFAFGAVVLVIIVFFLPETLRSLVGNGSIPPPRLNQSLVSLWQERQRKKRHGSSAPDAASIAAKPPRKGWRDVNLLAPLKLFGEKDIWLTLTFNSACYCLFYTVTTSTGTTFKATYQLSDTALGLCYLANGCGCLFASFANAPRMSHDYNVVKRQVERKRKEQGQTAEEEEVERNRDLNDLSTFPIEHARLRSLPYWFFALIAATITYGWLLDKAVHLSAPLIMQFIIGLSVTSLFNMVNTLLVDLYPGQSASATAANNLYRCLCGAAGTGFIDPLLNRLGAGWAFTMLSLLNCCFVPLIVLEWKYGMRIRLQRAERLAKKQERYEEKEREKGRELERQAREEDAKRAGQ